MQENLNYTKHGDGIARLFSRWDGYWFSELVAKETEDTAKKVGGTLEPSVPEKEKKEEEVTGIESTDFGVTYTINSKGRGTFPSIIALINGEEFSFPRIYVGSDKKKQETYFAAFPLDGNETITQDELNEEHFNTKVTGKSKNLKTAINLMLKKIKKILEGRETEIQRKILEHKVPKKIELPGLFRK